MNSTHVLGTKMMNGIGGSGDLARNARLAIFVTKSIAKNGNISSIVLFVSHVDHTEHDVDVNVTEQGYADLRGLAPREIVQLIIESCAHPLYREQLRAYYQEALQRGGQTPHVLEKALSWQPILPARVQCLKNRRKRSRFNKYLYDVNSPTIEAGEFLMFQRQKVHRSFPQRQA